MHHTPSIEIVCHTTPERLNEDAYLCLPAAPFNERIIVAAIDGATTRLNPPPLQKYLDSLAKTSSVRLTPAAYAARFIRDALARHITSGDQPATTPHDLRALMLAANADLGAALIDIFGTLTGNRELTEPHELTLEALQFPEEIYATLSHDPRLVRLGLPVCVATLAEYDPVEHTLRYAHAGDTSLLVVYKDGSISVPTAAAAKFDSSLLTAIGHLRTENPGTSARDLTQNPDVRRVNLFSGLRHNYVDEHGLPQPGQGVGVLNGQPELRYFAKTSELSLTGVAFVCVMTDGLEWPANAEEAFTRDTTTATALRDQRYLYMANEMMQHSLVDYLNLLRNAEAKDPDHNRFPRMKTHDDATGVLLRFE